MLKDDLAGLTAAELLRPVAGPAFDTTQVTFAFKHGLVQETAYGSMLLRDRREIHWHVARAYERLYDDQLEEHAALLAHHFAEAGFDAALTARYSALAGDTEYRRHAHREAVRHYSVAIEALKVLPAADATETRDLYLRRGRVLELAGQYSEALANYTEMGEAGRSRNDRAMEMAALIAEGTIRSTLTPAWDAARARELSRRALLMARELEDRAAEARLLWNLMLVTHFSGDPQGAIPYGQASVAIAQELGLQEQLAYTLNDIHRSYSAVGSIASAQAVLAQAEMLWRKLDNPHMLADSLNSGAELAMLVGDYDTALTKAHEGDRVSTLVDNSWGKAYSAITLSLIYFEQGEFGAAIEAAGRSIAYAQSSGFFYSSVAALTCLSMIRAEIGDTQGSLAAAEQAVANATRLFSSVLGAVELAHATHALALVSAKRIADAERVMAPYPSPLEVEHGQIAIAGIETAITWMAHGAIRLAKRDYLGVIRTTEGFINGLRGFAVHAFMADILLLRGQALRHLGQIEPARDAVEKGVQLCRSSGSCRALWPSLVEVALLDDAAGCHDEAAAHRAEAREIVRRLAAQAPEEVRATFLARPEVRALVNGAV